MAGGALRIVLCTRGGLHGALVLRRLLESPRVEVAGIVLSSRMLNASDGFIAGARAFVRRSGVAYSAYLFCSTTLADIALRFAAPGTVARQARRRGIAVRVTRRIGEAATREFIAACAPDLLVSAFFNQRIGEDTARLARLGAVNIHPSALPDFKGVDPVFYARLRKAAHLGVSVHRVTPDFDAGPLLARESILDDRRGESVLAATARLYERGARLLVQSLDALEAGAAGSPQAGEGCYDSWPSRGEVASLEASGIPLARVSDLWPPAFG